MPIAISFIRQVTTTLLFKWWEKLLKLKKLALLLIWSTKIWTISYKKSMISTYHLNFLRKLINMLSAIVIKKQKERKLFFLMLEILWDGYQRVVWSIQQSIRNWKNNLKGKFRKEKQNYCWEIMKIRLPREVTLPHPPQDLKSNRLNYLKK